MVQSGQHPLTLQIKCTPLPHPTPLGKIMLNLPIDYYICCTISVVGVLQIASNTANLDKLRFLRRRSLNAILASSLLLTSFILFFFTADRNINDIHGGLDGNQQMVLFVCSFVTAFIVNAVISSCINNSTNNHSNVGSVGIELLRHKTYWHIFKRPTIHWLKFLKSTITR